MLLTITYSGKNATDLGYLLFKNPHRPQEFHLNYGKAYVFYPEISEIKCTVALLLDIDPLDLARGKVGSKDGGLFDYVNDRPYVSSSFLSTALTKVFGTAMTGRCDKRPELAEIPLHLTSEIKNLPCRGSISMINKIFEPLGYQVSYEEGILDEEYPQWGKSRYVNLKLTGNVKLQSLLKHLYVLIPVFDNQKHYWIGNDEVDKLLRHGEDWLEAHPEKDFIVRRYVGGRRGLAQKALEELVLDVMDDGHPGAVSEVEEDIEPPLNLNTRRLNAVLEAVKNCGASSVIDMGCGEGRLLSLLLKESKIKKIAGMDVSWSVLERASQKLHLDRMTETQKSRIGLFQSSLTYKDKRFENYEAACIIEVIEHLDENRLSAFEQVVFGEAKPRTVILTTPNVEYNENYASLEEGKMRHGDHRFEWSRAEFQKWADQICKNFDYEVAIHQVGDEDENLGTPTQMGVFTKCG